MITKEETLSLLKELSEASGIAYNALCSLDMEAQKEVAYEFLADDTDMEHIFSVVSKALNVLELNLVSELTGIPFPEFSSLDEKKKEQLCGHYSMCYEPDEPNTELAAELRKMFYS